MLIGVQCSIIDQVLDSWKLPFDIIFFIFFYYLDWPHDLGHHLHFWYFYSINFHLQVEPCLVNR